VLALQSQVGTLTPQPVGPEPAAVDLC